MTTQQLTAPFNRLFQGVGFALRSWATQRELEALDDRMLKDLGISRAQAEFAARPGSFGRNERPWHVGPHHDA